MLEMGTSGLTSGEWKRDARWDIQAPTTERVGLSYGPPTHYRATPRLHRFKTSLWLFFRPGPIVEPESGRAADLNSNHRNISPRFGAGSVDRVPTE